MRTQAIQILSGDDSTSVTGGKIDANQLYCASFIGVFADSAAFGTLKIQASNDPCGYGNVAMDFTPTNWVDIPNGSVVVPAGSVVIIPRIELSYRWIRAVYTRTSGGSSTVTVYMDSLGA